MPVMWFARRHSGGDRTDDMSPDSKHLAAVSNDTTLRRCDARNAPIRSVRFDKPRGFYTEWFVA